MIEPERVADLVREPRRDAPEHREPLGLVARARRHLERAAREPEALGEVAGEQRDDDDRRAR